MSRHGSIYAREDGVSMKKGSMIPEYKMGGVNGAGLMPLSLSIVCVAFLSLLLSPLAAAETSGYLLYLPADVAMGESTRQDNGVLVKKILVRPGDTLSRLSRRFSGKAYYYPQILLFNKIANPDRIYAGKELLVPVPSHPSRTRPERSTAGRRSRVGGRNATPPAGTALQGKVKDTAASGRILYEQAVSLYAGGKYREAVDVFSRFLLNYPESPLASDASLYRADCYLRLSEL